jgi:hypothetical protein
MIKKAKQSRPSQMGKVMKGNGKEIFVMEGVFIFGLTVNHMTVIGKIT